MRDLDGRGNARVGAVAMLAMVSAAVLSLSGCLATSPTLGGSSNTDTGSAGGATATNANSNLERCDESLGTLAVVILREIFQRVEEIETYEFDGDVPILHPVRDAEPQQAEPLQSDDLRVAQNAPF